MTFALTPKDPRIHVFSVSDGPVKLAHQTYLSRLSSETEGTPLAEALGADIDATYAEVFAVRDVEPMGLRAYLAQAHDIPEDALAADATRLDGLSGDVLVLAPRALDGVEALSPRPELTHIGSYAPAEADNAPRDLPRAVKEPSVVAPEVSEAPGPSKRMITVIVVVALLLAAVLFALL
ncbi:hypothetical protein SAMN05444004_10776 [Jannaschia faecimaris]|uniref:Aspartate carbamoyltransferase catalytic subunit n=1 Tax=Jannaschia faecimaris TaxID=1244108 RepID=A0A1H3QYR5_9RHOB|nr:hypothetical protein [Jannaschia faecimaris]SDZ18506.1 hypothetical protein SAMN05444004_10776 [Jannaschia faecimaris]